MRIDLTKPQSKFYQLTCRYPLFIGGYGSGKTFMLCVCALRDVFIAPDARVAVYSDTYDQLRLNIIPRIEEMLTTAGVKYRHNKAENVIELGGGRMLIFRSMDNPRRIIGYEVFRSHVDELEANTDMAKAEEIWLRIMARNRQVIEGHDNRVYVYTTPDQGFGFTYERWKKNPPSEEYQYVRASTFSNPHLPEDYAQALMSDYPPELAKAYLEGEWCNLTSGTVYNAFKRETCFTNREIVPGEPLHIGMDFNVGKMAAVVAVREGNRLFVVDEIVGVEDTPAIIDEIKKRYRNHAINVYPDASGTQRSTSDASRSDIALLQQAGFIVRTKKKNPSVRDRVVCVNARFSEGRLAVNLRRCPNLVEALEKQTYNNKGEPDKSQGYDHVNDALGYMVYYLMPLKTPALRRALWYK